MCPALGDCFGVLLFMNTPSTITEALIVGVFGPSYRGHSNGNVAIWGYTS